MAKPLNRFGTLTQSVDLGKLYGAETDWGTNPHMNKPNSKGALGMFQLTPIAYEDLIRKYPTKYGSTYSDEGFQKLALDAVGSQEAVYDFMNIIENDYMPYYKIPKTKENLLQIYNIGIGDFVKGKRNPEYIKRYNRKYKKRK